MLQASERTFVLSERRVERANPIVDRTTGLGGILSQNSFNRAFHFIE